MDHETEPARRAPAPAAPSRLDWVAKLTSTLLARFAWPAAFVAVAAMALAHLRHREAPPASEIRVEHSGATVVRELRALSRLETGVLRVEKIIELADHQRRLSGLVEANDAILFVAAGEVVLGVDLAKLTDADLHVDPATNTAYIELPPPEILSTRFDEQRSYVHSRRTDLFARRNEGLEATARREALAAFAEAGKDPRSLEAARAQAETQLRALARAWGARDLVVTWKGPRGEVADP